MKKEKLQITSIFARLNMKIAPHNATSELKLLVVPFNPPSNFKYFVSS